MILVHAVYPGRPAVCGEKDGAGSYYFRQVTCVYCLQLLQFCGFL